MNNRNHALVFGATGNTGGAAARELLRRGWQVRAVTRNPKSKKAQAIARLGVELVQGNMDDRQSLQPIFKGVRRVLSVQNWMTAGVAGEVRQGRLVADLACEAEVEHLVYISAGNGAAGTGIPHFDSKLEVEAYMRGLGLPFTILRPAPFMELLTDKAFFPALAAWGTEPKVVGWDTPLPWVAVRDIGITVANLFENPEIWIGREVSLFGDVKTLRQCQAAFEAIDGKKPLGLPLPVGLFRRMAGEAFIEMWQWVKNLEAEVGAESFRQVVEKSRLVCPEILDVEGWLRTRNYQWEVQADGI